MCWGLRNYCELFLCSPSKIRPPERETLKLGRLPLTKATLENMTKVCDDKIPRPWNLSPSLVTGSSRVEHQGTELWIDAVCRQGNYGRTGSTSSGCLSCSFLPLSPPLQRLWEGKVLEEEESRVMLFWWGLPPYWNKSTTNGETLECLRQGNNSEIYVSETIGYEWKMDLDPK